MPVIKRYPNRKLYDTEAKQYVTLEGIAEIIRKGSDVDVIDHATGENLTALTLTQIIFEQEKKQSGLIPGNVLSGVIRAGGDRLSSIQRALASSLNIWRQIDEEIKHRVQKLVSQGELTEVEGNNLIDKLLNQGSPLQVKTTLNDAYIERILVERQVPTRQDLQNLLDQLEELNTKLEEFSQSNP